MRKEITYKKQGDGRDSWEIKEYDFRPVDRVLKTEVSKDEKIFTDIKEIGPDGNIVTDLKEVLVSANMVFENPNAENRVDLKTILTNASNEEIEFIKQILK